MKTRALLTTSAVCAIAALTAAQPAVAASRGGFRGPVSQVSHWNGGHRVGFSGHRHFFPGWGFYAAAPFIWGSLYWGYPYGYYGPRYYGYYPAYPVYGDDPDDRYMMAPPAEPTTNVPAGNVPGAPTQGPLYQNYCESAKAYFPKVTSCPEGWQMRRPQP